MTARRDWPAEIVAFVKERAETPGWSYPQIAAAVNEKWPGSGMTKQAASRVGKVYRSRGFHKKRDAAPQTPVEVRCRFKWLERGQLHRCEAEGYPHCANHKKKLTEVPSGSRYPQSGGGMIYG